MLFSCLYYSALFLLFSISSAALHPEMYHPAPAIPKWWAWSPGSTGCKGSPGRPMAGQPFSHFYSQRRDFVVSWWIRAVEFFFCSGEQSVPISPIKKFLCLCKIPTRKPFPAFLWETRYRMSSQWINQSWTDRVNRGKENFTSRPWCHRINTYKRKTFLLFPKKWHVSLNSKYPTNTKTISYTDSPSKDRKRFFKKHLPNRHPHTLGVQHRAGFAVSF